MSTITHRSVEFKLYPNKTQEAPLLRWLEVCREIYNHALADRQGAYRIHGKTLTYNTQSLVLTGWRKTVPGLAACPTLLERDALRRLDKAFKAFFRRVKAGQKPGYPRFKKHDRYRSMEFLATNTYLRDNKIFVPGLGLVPCRGHHQDATGKQKALRVIHRASGWYAQILCEREIEVPREPVGPAVGIDLGLENFATYSTAEIIENPRFLRRGQRKLKFLQRSVSRKRKGSKNRKKAVRKLARQHERVQAQRKDFAHKESRNLVNHFGLICHEDLNIIGLAKGICRKSVQDAGWGIFLAFLAYKAANAGKRVVKVDPAGTSQECPKCGAIRKKALSERIHECPCGYVTHRDHASSLVVLHRGSNLDASPVEGTTSMLSANSP